MIQLKTLKATHTDEKGKAWGMRFAADGIALYYKITDDELNPVQPAKSHLVPKEVKAILLDKSQQPETVAEPEVDEVPLKQEKVCIFCGEYADSGKFINQRFWPLCKDDYRDHTTGQVVAHIRELAHDTSTE